MIRLGLIPCLGAALALPACIVTHGLGETAEESGEGSGESSGGTEGDTDPGATSGQPITTTDPSGGIGTSEGTDSDPSAGESTTVTDGETCEGSPEYARWQFSGASLSPLEGIDASFAAILLGECVVTKTSEMDAEWSIWLQCSLEGRIDGDPDVSGEFAPHIQMTGTVPPNEVLDTLGGPVRLKVVLDWWGMGWNAWLVLETLAGAPLLDLVNAEYVDPTQSTWGPEVTERLAGESWHGSLEVSTATPDPICQVSVTDCDDEASMVVMRWSGAQQAIYLPAGHEDVLPTPIPELSVRASVTSAHTFPEPTCTDMALASYALAAWAVSP